MGTKQQREKRRRRNACPIKIKLKKSNVIQQKKIFLIEKNTVNARLMYP